MEAQSHIQFITTGAAGSTTANSHVKHVEGSSLGCEYCHLTTTTSSSIPPTSVVSAGPHLNRVEDVSMKSVGGRTGIYNTDKTCSSTYCHGSGASPAWGGSTNCSTCHRANNDGNLSVSTTAGHAIHYNTATLPTSMTDNAAHTDTGYVYGCQNCHPTNTHSAGPANSQRDAEIGGTKISSANYTQGAILATDPQGFKYTANGTCTTVCHTRDGVSGSPIVTPVWNVSKTIPNCGVCHNKVGNASPVWSAPHTKHVQGGANYSYTCNACHSTVASDNSTVINRTLHVNASKDVAFNTSYSGTFNTTTKSCSNNYCHSTGTSNTPTYPAPIIPATWGTTFTNPCKSCHGGAASVAPAGANVIATGSHQSHVNNAGIVGLNYTCDRCHSNVMVAGSESVIGNMSLHVNKEVNISFQTIINPGTVARYAGSTTPMTKAPGSPYGACTNLYCHSTGKAADVPTTALPAAYNGSHYVTMTWGSGATIGCNGCHGRSTTTGAPDYTSMGVGTAGSNSHMAHTAGATEPGTCNTCHSQTTLTGLTIITCSTRHANTMSDVIFNTTKAGSSAAYSTTTGSCSNLACHGTATWGGSSMDCLGCHAVAVGDRRQITGAGGDFVRQSRHVSNGTTTQIVTAFDCIVCHMEGDDKDH